MYPLHARGRAHRQSLSYVWVVMFGAEMFILKSDNVLHHKMLTKKVFLSHSGLARAQRQSPAGLFGLFVCSVKLSNVKSSYNLTNKNNWQFITKWTVSINSFKRQFSQNSTLARIFGHGYWIQEKDLRETRTGTRTPKQCLANTSVDSVLAQIIWV